MGKNLLQRQAAELEAVFNAGIAIGVQTACDYVAISLHDSETMKGKPMGSKRIKRILDCAVKLDERFAKAFSITDKEADYTRILLDRELKEIYGDDFPSFDERYPNIKKVKR